MTATVDLCPCGKAATHVNADEESQEWPCRVPPVLDLLDVDDPLADAFIATYAALVAAEANLATALAEVEFQRRARERWAG